MIIKEQDGQFGILVSSMSLDTVPGPSIHAMLVGTGEFACIAKQRTSLYADKNWKGIFTDNNISHFEFGLEGLFKTTHIQKLAVMLFSSQ